MCGEVAAGAGQTSYSPDPGHKHPSLKPDRKDRIIWPVKINFIIKTNIELNIVQKLTLHRYLGII
jgi:hypothetical protein